MGFKTRLSTKGFEDYLEKLASAGADIDGIADEALLAGGTILKDGMQRRAPERTGNLKSHIRLEGPDQDGNFHFVDVGVLDVERPKELYFFYQEFGTANTAAQPFIRPTLDSDWKRARAAMKEIFVARGAL